MTADLPADLPADSLTAHLARRVAERDNPSPPVVSHEPAAVQARVEAWLLTAYAVDNVRGRRSLARMLLALALAPECPTTALAQAAGVGRRVSTHYVVRLFRLGLTDLYYQGRVRYHRLRPATEDALLAVLRGEVPAPAGPAGAA